MCFAVSTNSQRVRRLGARPLETVCANRGRRICHRRRRRRCGCANSQLVQLVKVSRSTSSYLANYS